MHTARQDRGTSVSIIMPCYANRQSIEQALAADARARAAAPSHLLVSSPKNHQHAFKGQFLNAGAVLPPSIEISENAIAASNQARVPKRDAIKFDLSDEKPPKRTSSIGAELHPPPMRCHDGVRSVGSMSFDDLHEIFMLCGGSEADVVKLCSSLWGAHATAIAPIVRAWFAAISFPPIEPPSRSRSAPPVSPLG